MQVQHLPHLWQPLTIKEPSNFFSIQSKTWCLQLSLLTSTEVYKAPFDLGFSLDFHCPHFYYSCLVSVWYPLLPLTSTHCCCLDCGGPMAWLDCLPQFYVVTAGLPHRSLLWPPYSHFLYCFQVMWFSGFKGEDQIHVPYIRICPKLIGSCIFPPFMTNPRRRERAEPLREPLSSD